MRPSSPGISSVSGLWLHFIFLGGRLACITESILAGEQPFICLTTRVTQYSGTLSPVLGVLYCVLVVALRSVIYNFAKRRTLVSHMGVLMARSRASCGVDATAKVLRCSSRRKFSSIPFCRKAISSS